MGFWAGSVPASGTIPAQFQVHFPFRPDETHKLDVDLPSIESLAQDHHGLVTRAGVKGRGVSRSAWYRALAAGVIEPVHPGVARLVGTSDTPEQRIAAAVLGAAQGAMASHRSAARLWGVPRPPEDPIDVMLPDRRRESTLAGVVVHRPRDCKDLSPVLRSGIRTSNVLRMLCDLGAVDPATVAAAVGHVVTTGLASPVALRNAVEVHARRGRHGVPAFREALDEWVIDGKPVDSVLEPAMRRLGEEHRLPAMEFHAVICGYEVDFWIVGSPVVLECDGWDTHGRNRAQFERDRVRDARLATEGYITVRFTHRQLTQRAAQTAERIRAVLQRWAPQLLAPTR